MHLFILNLVLGAFFFTLEYSLACLLLFVLSYVVHDSHNML